MVFFIRFFQMLTNSWPTLYIQNSWNLYFPIVVSLGIQNTFQHGASYLRFLKRNIKKILEEYSF